MYRPYFDSVLPASVFGFASTGAAVLFSGFIGNIVDTTPRLRLVRLSIVAQKVTVAAGYACFFVKFLRLRQGQDTGKWALFGVATLLAAIANLSTVSDSHYRLRGRQLKLSLPRLPSRCPSNGIGPSLCAKETLFHSLSSTRESHVAHLPNANSSSPTFAATSVALTFSRLSSRPCSYPCSPPLSPTYLPSHSSSVSESRQWSPNSSGFKSYGHGYLFSPLRNRHGLQLVAKDGKSIRIPIRRCRENNCSCTTPEQLDRISARRLKIGLNS